MVVEINEEMDRMCNLSESLIDKGREEARNETWAYIGEGASRITDYLIEKHKSMKTAEEDKAE